MDEFFPFIFATTFLAMHLHWSFLDPHNPIDTPGIIYAIFVAIIVMTGLKQTNLWLSQGQDDFAALLGAFSLGIAFGPAINTPYRLRRDEEPSWLARKVQSIGENIKGTMLKTLVLAPLTLVAGYFFGETSWIWAAVFLGLTLNISKTETAYKLIQSKEITELLVNTGPQWTFQRIVEMSTMGNFGFLCWLYIARNMIFSIPHMNFGHLKSWVARMAGLLISQII